ncbi:kinase-like protein [Mycena rebaudengoi]|nr:kinase-like protein [Mycena rebaudengoi]
MQSPGNSSSLSKYNTVTDPRRKTRPPVNDFVFVDGNTPTDPNTMDTKRPPVRMNPQDGLWSVSVAETPDDARSYSLYIKTPTHNLTLTRTAVELVDLDRKLREANPTTTLPALPIDPSSPPKRKTKSTFLNTLSRLASPSANRTARTRPAASPQTEASDPFLSFEGVDPPSSTTLAAYLTTVSNTPTMRQARVWKRFVRVRTDDLESVRVERAIKRVRSDLASHGVRNKENVAVAVEEEAPPVPEEPVPEDPPATDTARIPRSQSADPDKRLSRAFTQDEETPQTDPEEMTSSQTGETDDSSISTTGHATQPKKRASKKKLLGPRKSTRKVVIDDFEMMRVLGKGCAGKVLLVKHKTTADLYALKAITKRHVLAHQELQHTLTEQAVLKRMAAESKDPFVVKLWWSFHDKENLFLVMDFHPGGDLATQLARWGRLGRDRARFYAAEIVEGPENILIGGDGHIVLTDFGLSKEFPRRTAAITAPSTPSGSRSEFYSSAAPNVVSVNGSTVPATPPWMKAEKGGELAAGWPGQPVGQTADTTTTFCGTAEYLAPEVIQGLAYSYEVDWWSFGTMLYEMLTGITPFWANNHSDMYVRVLQDELQFPDDRAIDQDTKSLIRGLLQRNPALRICEPRIKRHPYFSMIDWSHVYYKRYIPPYIPPIDPSNASDTQNFDDTFLDMEPVLDDANEDAGDTDAEPQTDAEPTDGEESNTTPSQSRSSSIHPPVAQATTPAAPEDDSVDVFDGYSFKGRHSVLLDDEDEEEGSEEGERGAEPKTPEARPVVPVEPVPELPELPAQQEDAIMEEPRVPEPEPEPEPEVVPATTTDTAAAAPVAVREEPKPRKSKEQARAPVPEKELPAPQVPPKPSRLGRPRREKSGDAEATEKEDEEDDDWDFVEAADGEDRNGAKGTSLFARGVVDRYRLAVFRKASTPSQRTVPRSFSGISRDSEATGAGTEASDSPSPSQRRGRTPGLTFRKHPRQFLRPKSPPPSSYSSKSSLSGSKPMSRSNSATMSSSGGLLTPSPSASATMMSPSLKSKESAMSMGAQSSSSGENGKVDVLSDGRSRAPSSPPDGGERPKNKKAEEVQGKRRESIFVVLVTSPASIITWPVADSAFLPSFFPFPSHSSCSLFRRQRRKS